MLTRMLKKLSRSKYVAKSFSYESENGKVTIQLRGKMEDVKNAVESIRKEDEVVGPYEEWKDISCPDKVNAEFSGKNKQTYKDSGFFS